METAFDSLVVRQKVDGWGAISTGVYRVPGNRGHKPLRLYWGIYNVSGTGPGCLSAEGTKEAASSAT